MKKQGGRGAEGQGAGGTRGENLQQLFPIVPNSPCPCLNYLRRPTYYLLSCIFLTSFVTSFLGVNLTDSARSLFLIPGTTTVLFSNRPR